jgi:NAD-dependent dihydropyrimidine dehydrogenase PreA subunit
VADEQEIYVYPPDTPTHWPCEFDEKLCNGCNHCVRVCSQDVFIPNPIKGKPPIVVHPQECWLCGSCEEHCPRPGAVRMNQPVNQRARWKRKETGEVFRIGMANPPSPNTRPPAGKKIGKKKSKK